MSKIKDNIIFKIVVCILVTIVMALIVLNVYAYYNELAKKRKNNEEISQENIDDEEDNEEASINFNEFKNKKTNIKINGEDYTIDIEKTDAGDVFILDEYALVDVSFNTQISYATFSDILILKVSYDDYDLLYIINKDGKILKSYNKETLDNDIYNIKKPLITKKFQDSVTIKGSNIYLTYVLDNFDKTTESNKTIQYTIKIVYENGRIAREDEIIEKYNYSEYLKNKS